jgi:RNA polymerase sigma-70 factor (ECF subfamily)
MGNSAAAHNAFPTTHWTLVIAAGGKQSGLERSVALESLCRSYWYPVYAFIRRRGYPPAQAQDLTQEFFLRILGGAFFERANPDKGRFRSFLLGAVNHFLSDASDRQKSQKRGGGVAPLSFDFESGESNYSREPGHAETPERIFQRKWARTVLDRVMRNLQDEFSGDGRQAFFNRIKCHLTSDRDVKYADLARELSLTESGIKAAIRRMRFRYRDLLRAEVASTVVDASDIDEELRSRCAPSARSREPNRWSAVSLAASPWWKASCVACVYSPAESGPDPSCRTGSDAIVSFAWWAKGEWARYSRRSRTSRAGTSL